jgi:hypothetical protein
MLRDGRSVPSRNSEDVCGGSAEMVSYSEARQYLRTRGMGRPKKYHTEEERRRAARQSQRKYIEANHVAIRARQAVRDRKKRAAIKRGIRYLIGKRENPRAALLGGRDG